MVTILKQLAVSAPLFGPCSQRVHDGQIHESATAFLSTTSAIRRSQALIDCSAISIYRSDAAALLMETTR
jgi:hypothetical protein